MKDVLALLAKIVLILLGLTKADPLVYAGMHKIC